MLLHRRALLHRATSAFGAPAAIRIAAADVLFAQTPTPSVSQKLPPLAPPHCS